MRGYDGYEDDSYIPVVHGNRPGGTLKKRSQEESNEVKTTLDSGDAADVGDGGVAVDSDVDHQHSVREDAAKHRSWT